MDYFCFLNSARIRRRSARVLWAPLLSLVLAACEIADPLPGQFLGANYTAPPVPTSHVRSDIVYDDVSGLSLDVYLPEVQTKGLIVFVHGGAWVSGSKDGNGGLNGMQAVLRQVSRGWAVASVDYTLASVEVPTGAFPEMLHDIKRAIRYLKVNHAEYDIVTAVPLIVWGSSAGGHLAGMVGTSSGVEELEPDPESLPLELAAVDSSVHGVVSMAGPLDVALTAQVSAWSWAVGALLSCPDLDGDGYLDAAACDPADLELASVETHYDPLDPPIYMAFGAMDAVVPKETGVATALAYLFAGKGDLCWVDVDDTSVSQGHNVELFANMAAVDGGLDYLALVHGGS